MPDVETPRASPAHAVVRAKVLDAAEECLRRFGAADTTMEDVAEVAEISRATLYRYFDGREAVLLGVAGRDIDRYLARLAARLDDIDDPVEVVLEFSTRVIGAARRDDTLAVLFGGSGRGRGAAPRGAFDMLFARTVEFLAPYVAAGQRDGSFDLGLDPRDAADWILRMVVSLVMVPGIERREGDELRVHLERYLVPSLVRV